MECGVTIRAGTENATPKMDAQAKAKWLAALRSGKYEQANGTLKTDGGRMCCLGVLRDVMEPGASYEDEETIYLRSEHCPSGLIDGHRSILAHMNDGTNSYHQHSFAEIADWIEANL